MVEQQKYDKVKQALHKVIEENKKIQRLVDKQEMSKNLLLQEKEMLLKKLMEYDESLLSSDTDREIQVTAATSTLSSLADATPSKIGSTPGKRLPKKLKKVLPYEKTPEGNPVLPAVFGQTTLLSLGKISLKPGYHSQNYIYPVGFKTKRSYMSFLKLEPVEYTCEIVDGGDAPKFQITAHDDPENPIVASSASGAWTIVMKGNLSRLILACCKLRSKEFTSSVSGPEYFGFSQPTILSIIQEMENAGNLEGYNFQEFEVKQVKKPQRKKIKKDVE